MRVRRAYSAFVVPLEGGGGEASYYCIRGAQISNHHLQRRMGRNSLRNQPRMPPKSDIHTPGEAHHHKKNNGFSTQSFEREQR